MTNSGPVFLGIDGGGTGCRATLVNHKGAVLGVGSSGAANIMTHFSRATESVISASGEALHNSGIEGLDLSDIPAFLGLAGANIGNLAENFRSELPFQRCSIDTDAVISLEGAIGGGDGAAAIIGTGSVFISRTSGEIQTVGGWGFTVGDLASGAWLGRRLLQETLLSYDGVHRGSSLTNTVLNRFRNDPQTVVEYAHTARPGEFGELAPLVFEFVEKRDPIARQILRRALSDIEETLDLLLPDGPVRFCMIGGLGPIYAEMLSNYYRSRVCEPLGDAAAGAASLACKMFADEVVQ
ncbi:MAG: BadF/BadG/BcrA/BcrD ATPase family protein [Rhizobiaceae bacterium]